MHSKKTKRSERTSQIILGFIFLLLLCFCSFYGWHYAQQMETEATLVREYDSTLRNARDLLLRYRNISMHLNQASSTSSDAKKYPKNIPTTVDLPPDVAISSTSKETLASFNSNSAPSSLKSTNTISIGKSKDIIIGMAQDTDPKNLAVFCGSLRRVSDADVVIFINAPVPERHKEIAGKYNIQLIDFDLASLDASLRKYHPSTLRWPLIYNFFKDTAIQSKYNRVWMIDVRDSAFQKDPFVMLAAGESAFYAFGGVEDKLIADCGWNAGWIRDCFGEQGLISQCDFKGTDCDPLPSCYRCSP